MITPRTRAVWFILILLIPCVARAQRSADDNPDPSFTAAFGIAQTIKNGAWCPIRLDITGGSVPMDGVARISVGRGVSTDFVIDAPFAATPSKTTHVDVCVPMVATSPYADQERWARVSLIGSRGEIIQSARYTERGESNTLRMFAVLADESQPLLVNVGRTTLRGATNIWATQYTRFPEWSRVVVGNELAESLPTLSMGYAALDALVMTQETLESLGTAQRDALRDWIIAGGRAVFIAERAPMSLSWLPAGAPARLVVDGSTARPRWQITDAGRASGWSVLSLEPPPRPDNADGTQPDADDPATASARGVDAVAQGIVGGGWVTLLAGDPGDIFPWADKGELWAQALRFTIDRSTLPPDNADPWTRQTFGASAGPTNALLNAIAADMDIRARFPIPLFAGVLALLALAVGPVDRLLLRRWRLSGMAWLSSLVWIALVSTLAYFGPGLFRTSSSIQSRVATIDINSIDSTAARSGVTTLFAGKSGGRGVSGGHDGAWWRPISTTRDDWNREPQSDVTLYALQGPGVRPERVYMGVWTLNSLADDAVIDPPYDATLVRGADGSLELRGLPEDARDVLVARGGHFFNATPNADGAWRLRASEETLARRYGVTLTGANHWGALSHQYIEEISGAATALPGPRARTRAFSDASSAPELAMIFFTRTPDESDVTFTLAGRDEARRVVVREVVRMLVRVPQESEQ